MPDLFFRRYLKSLNSTVMTILIIFSILLIHFYLKFQKQISNYGKCDCGCKTMFSGMLFLTLCLFNINGFGQAMTTANQPEITGDFYYLEIENDRTYLGIITAEDEMTVTIETKESRIMKFQKSSVLSCEIVTWEKSKKNKKWVKHSNTNQTKPIWFTDLAKNLL